MRVSEDRGEEMTREELIALAKEADCAIHEIAELERFANLVAAKEREECAGICERFYAREMNAAECAAAIRARKP